MNETLESVARAVFQSWFVDFDPIRVRIEGRQPFGMDAESAAQFPCAFTDSPLGEIPLGWRVGSIFEQARLLGGGTPKTSCQDYWNGSIMWASAKDVSQSSDLLLITTERSITPLGLQNSSTRLIPPLSTVIVARGATTGRLVLLGTEMAMNQTCYALHSRFDCPFTLYFQLRNAIEKLTRAAHGSVFDTITTVTFESCPVLLPSEHVLRAFNDVVRPYFDSILVKQRETLTLITIRDSLLPKLMSGEVRVREAEKTVEAYV